MKKISVLSVLACMIVFFGCAAITQPKQGKTDIDYYTYAMYYFNAKSYFEAIPAFEELRGKFPLSPFAILSELRLGESHYFKEEYAEASHYFDNFRRFHPSNQHVSYSVLMAGMCHYKEILTADRDQTAAKEAVEQFQILYDLFPGSPYTGKALCKMSEAKKRIAEHEFFVGNFYFKKENYKGAIDRYRNILDQYPHSIDKDKLLFHLAQATIKSGRKDEGDRILKLLLKRYPESIYKAEAKGLLLQ